MSIQIHFKRIRATSQVISVSLSFLNFCISCICIHNLSYAYRRMENIAPLLEIIFPKTCRERVFLHERSLPEVFPAHAIVSFLWVRLWWQVRILVKDDFPLVLDFFFNFFWFLSEIPSSSMMALKERHWRTWNNRASVWSTCLQPSLICFLSRLLGLWDIGWR